MLKIVALVMAVCLLFCLVACSTSDADKLDGSSQSQSNAKITIRDERNNSDIESATQQSQNSQVSPDGSEKTNMLPAIIDIEQEEYRPCYLLGNCKRLKGNPLVVLLFVDDDDSSWSASEVTEYINNYVDEGLKYLEDKAKEWNVDLKFSVKAYSTPLSDYTLKYEGSVTQNLKITGSTKDILDQMAHDMGYSSNWELYSKFKTEHGANDDVIFLTFLNKPGTSYARHVNSTGRTSYTEHGVIFSDYLEGGSFGCKASTVAHELLHLFGAEDFYAEHRKMLAYQIYPKDIMLWMPTEVYENEIGAFTAYTVGWTDTVPSVCYDENWWK